MFGYNVTAVLTATVGVLLLSAFSAFALDGPLRLGDNRLDAEIGDWRLDVYTYRPFDCAQPSVLLVFHGNGRGASSYRDSAEEMADQSCFVVYSPLFDESRFPSAAYHRGGLFGNGTLLDAEDWTVSAAGEIVDWIQAREGGGRPVFLFGHSAGAQFLSRVAAYARPDGIERIVLANPSTYVMPSLDWPAPYGFGDLPPELANEDAIRDYLAAPVTIYLGKDDTGQADLTRNEYADRQGDNRLERGRWVFDFAQRTARENGWAFGWILVEVPGVGHTARGMLRAPELIEALGFTTN